MTAVLALVGASAQTPVYTRAATESCLAGLPNAVVGLPPASPPVPPVLFVDPLPRGPHAQIGAWYGERNGTYSGIILTFFKDVAHARASGGKRIRNVVVTSDQPTPSARMRTTVLGCLRSKASGGSTRPAPRASLATFAGAWGGHTRELSIAPAGRGRERTDDGCCTHVYDMTFQILSVSGTLTRATAVYRVTSFKRFDGEVKARRPGDVGRLLLRNGIVTNTLTGIYFCSDPAWGATGACGA